MDDKDEKVVFNPSQGQQNPVVPPAVSSQPAQNVPPPSPPPQDNQSTVDDSDGEGIVGFLKNEPAVPHCSRLGNLRTRILRTAFAMSCGVESLTPSFSSCSVIFLRSILRLFSFSRASAASDTFSSRVVLTLP